jgi:putative ABC transport system permease protein
MHDRKIYSPLLVGFDFVVLVLRGLRSRPSLTMLNLFGIVLAIGLVSNASFFAQAVDRTILNQELNALSRQTGRPPFSMRVYYFPSSRAPFSIVNAEEASKHVAGSLSSEIGLPLNHLGVQVESGGLMLQALAEDTRYSESGSFLGTVNITYIDGIEDKLTTVHGDPFNASGESAADLLDVWMHRHLAERMGLDPGEIFQLALNVRQPIVNVRIAGVWQSNNPTEEFWFKNPDTTLREALLVRRADYIRHIEPALASKTRLASWHLILNDGGLNPSYAQQYVEGFERGMGIIERFLPGARLDVSPLNPLRSFVQRQTTLTTLLLSFNVPALAFLLYFLGLISLIVARRQRREISILVSRGMSRMVVLWMILVEQIALFILALPLGIASGMGLAWLMGYTESFLSFTQRDVLPVSLQGLDLRLVGAALGVVLLARLLTALGMAGYSVVQQERTHARSTQPAFWQRHYIDLILILPTAYIYRQLSIKGTFATVVDGQSSDIFQDPLLILTPVLFVVTAALLSMRLFPLLMTLLDWLAERSPWITPHLVLRQLARHTADYTAPLLLVIVLLAMGIYTVSMAASLDQWLVDRIYYQVGADIRFMPVIPNDSGSGEPVVVPPETFARIPGVAATARVGDYPMQVNIGGGRPIRGRFMAVDRLDFPEVLWFRSDFAGESVGALMNRLALAPENILVSQRFLNENVFEFGDSVSLRVTLDSGIQVERSFTIAGVYNYFPTVYDADLVMVGNLEPLFFELGAEFPHHIWLRLEPDAPSNAFFNALTAMNLAPAFKQDALTSVQVEQARLERVGIFGTLSVGFLAAALMAALAMLVHGFASLQERIYQFGVLRAMGLGQRQVLLQVIQEYAFLTIYCALGGLAIGILTTELFIPFFRITGDATLPLPPLIPIIVQEQIIGLTLFFVTALIIVEIVVVTQGLRQRIFETLRLGNPG